MMLWHTKSTKETSLCHLHLFGEGIDKDELIVEYHKAQADWDKITKDLALWGGSTTIALAATAATAILTGNMSLSIPAIALSAYGLHKVVTSRMEKKEFKKKFPMAVFVDLNNKK